MLHPHLECLIVSLLPLILLQVPPEPARAVVVMQMRLRSTHIAAVFLNVHGCRPTCSSNQGFPRLRYSDNSQLIVSSKDVKLKDYFLVFETISLITD
jgi:hypothetical protein